MHICIVNEFFHPDNTGGTGTVLSDLVQSLRGIDPNLKVDVVTSTNLYRRGETKLPAFEDWDGVAIHRVATPHPNSLPVPLRLGANLMFCASAFAKLLSLPAYDVVLVGTAPPMVALTALALLQRRKTPFVYVVYDLEPDRSVTMKVLPPKHPFVQAFGVAQKRWLNSAAKVIVLGEYMGEHLTRTYGVPPQNIQAIPVGSNPAEIVPSPKNSRFRAAHGISGFLVLYSGNFGRYHNFNTVLDAARLLRDTHPQISFALVGDGAQKAHIVARIAAEDLSNVRLFDFVPKEDYADLLASADLSFVTLEPGMEGLCVPSKFYSILASGRPVLATVSPLSEVARVIDEAQAGVHMEQSATEALAATVVALSENPAEAERMGRNARRVLEDQYSVTEVARRYYAVLQAACRPQAAASPAATHLSVSESLSTSETSSDK